MQDCLHELHLTVAIICSCVSRLPVFIYRAGSSALVSCGCRTVASKRTIPNLVVQPYFYVADVYPTSFVTQFTLCCKRLFHSVAGRCYAKLYIPLNLIRKPRRTPEPQALTRKASRASCRCSASCGRHLRRGQRGTSAERCKRPCLYLLALPIGSIVVSFRDYLIGF